MTTFRTAFAITLILACSMPVLAHGASTENTKEFTRIEQELLKADTSGDTTTADKYLAADYVVRDSSNGKLYDKASAVKAVKASVDPSVKETIEDLQSATIGDFALVTYTAVVNMGEKTMKMKVADTFRKETDGWKLTGRTGTEMK